MSTITNYIQIPENLFKSINKDLSKLEELLEQQKLQQLDIDKYAGALTLVLSEYGSHKDADLSLIDEAINGGTVIDDKFILGYGPVSYLTTEKVIEFVEILEKIGKSDIKKYCNISEFNDMGLYPFEHDWDKSSVEDIIEVFLEWKSFYENCRNNKNIMLIYIS